MPLLLLPFVSFTFTFFKLYCYSLFIKPVIAGTTESSASSPPSILLLFGSSDNTTPGIPDFPHPFFRSLGFHNQYITFEAKRDLRLHCNLQPTENTVFVGRHSVTLYTFAGRTHTHRGEFPVDTYWGATCALDTDMPHHRYTMSMLIQGFPLELCNVVLKSIDKYQYCWHWGRLKSSSHVLPCCFTLNEQNFATLPSKKFGFIRVRGR